MTFTRALATNNYGPAKFIVDGTTTANGTHSTIATALTSASSGDTIFIRPGTYTENLTLKVGVNLTAYGSDSSLNGTGKVIISGTCTLTTAGSVTMSGIQLQTNSAALLAVTGSVASVVNLENCYLNCTNNTGITFSSSSASAAINLSNCNGDLGTTGIAIFSHSSAGSLNFNNTIFNNAGGSTTASTISSGSVGINRSVINNPITTSSTGTISAIFSQFSASNAIALTHGGSASSNLNYCTFGTGTAACVTISTTLALNFCSFNSTNATSVVTGAGTVKYIAPIFPTTGNVIDTTTQTTSGVMQGGRVQAPSAGFIGEQLQGTGSGVALVNTTSKTVASVSLTAGVWDVSTMVEATASGGTLTMTSLESGISNANNTTFGTSGIEYSRVNLAGLRITITTPPYRVTLTTTTTYYLVCTCFYTATSVAATGRITATRVG